MMCSHLETHHPFIVNASSVGGKHIICFAQTDDVFFHTSLIRLHTPLDGLFVHRYQVVVAFGKCFFSIPLITLSNVTIGAIFNRPPSTIMLNAFGIFISLAASIASMR